MGQIHLSIVTLKEIGHGALQNARSATGKTRGVPSARDPHTAGFDADHFHLLVPYEGMEESNRITPSADTGNEAIRQPAFCRQDLPPSFTSDDGLEVPDHHRIGMRPEH